MIFKDNDQCRFCTIDTINTKIVKEYKYCFVMLSNPRLMKGHLLVVPKRHVEKILALSREESEELFSAIAEYSERVLNSWKGYNIHYNYMPMLPESRTKVDHLHIHIWPRERDEDLYKKALIHEHGLFSDIEDGEFEEVMKRLSR